MSWVDFDRLSNGAGCALEDRFGDMVSVSPVVQKHVEVALSIGRECLPKVFDEFAVEFTDLLSRHGGLKDQVTSAAEVDGDGSEGFFHGQHDMTVTSDPRFSAEAIPEGLAEADTDIFGGVVSIDVDITDGFNLEIDERMFCEEDQHVVEESDTGLDVILTGAIEVQTQGDLCFCGCSVELASAMRLHGGNRAGARWGRRNGVESDPHGIVPSIISQTARSQQSSGLAIQVSLFFVPVLGTVAGLRSLRCTGGCALLAICQAISDFSQQ